MDRNRRQPSPVTFALRVIGVAVVPLLLLVGLYVIDDPFNIIKSSARYRPGNDASYGLSVNKGRVSMRALQSRIDQGDIPNSYILGASISCYFECEYWGRYLPSGSKPFHLDSSSEGVRSLRRKLQYLHDSGLPVDNALVVFSNYTLAFPPESSDLTAADPPELMPVHYLWHWHKMHFQAALDPDFLKSYVPWRLVGDRTCYGSRAIFDPQPSCYDPYYNEESIPAWDFIIYRDPDNYYVDRSFPDNRQLHSTGPHIDATKQAELRQIASLLSKTNYHIVIAPTLDGDTLHGRDLEALQHIFGREHVNNLSVTMALEAEADTNWYDRVHFRAPVARAIMDSIYSK